MSHLQYKNNLHFHSHLKEIGLTFWDLSLFTFCVKLLNERIEPPDFKVKVMKPGNSRRGSIHWHLLSYKEVLLWLNVDLPPISNYFQVMTCPTLLLIVDSK